MNFILGYLFGRANKENADLLGEIDTTGIIILGTIFSLMFILLAIFG